MTLNIRFVTLAALGAMLVGGVATAAELAGPARPGAVVTADGAVADGPLSPADAAEQAEQAIVVGPSVPPAPSGSPTSSTPAQLGTWGWG
ncbi:hypothetical protein [Kitasatospora cheerisanensis]|uniref:Uncharacterized protein n=1 Tax=Kitasatospora cheerisanensis KCTC 2395 TaxID=1348663 RepID=A0A066Z0N4_9ACTN|nr:hypothetical protein [Kitasatospora cheerisanensis]KDN83911.1 hypothetical protein KCH_45600 [Kitasatospora cheerisanensis KCTC 2395]